jgi:hypothetical protein
MIDLREQLIKELQSAGMGDAVNKLLTFDQAVRLCEISAKSALSQSALDIQDLNTELAEINQLRNGDAAEIGALNLQVQTLKDENEVLRGQVPKWLTVEEVSRKPINEYYVLRYNDSSRSHVLAVKADFVALHNAAPVSLQPLHAEEVKPDA